MNTEDVPHLVCLTAMTAMPHVWRNIRQSDTNREVEGDGLKSVCQNWKKSILRLLGAELPGKLNKKHLIIQSEKPETN